MGSSACQHCYTNSSGVPGLCPKGDHSPTAWAGNIDRHLRVVCPVVGQCHSFPRICARDVHEEEALAALLGCWTRCCSFRWLLLLVANRTLPNLLHPELSCNQGGFWDCLGPCARVAQGPAALPVDRRSWPAARSCSCLP